MVERFIWTVIGYGKKHYDLIVINNNIIMFVHNRPNKVYALG